MCIHPTSDEPLHVILVHELIQSRLEWFRSKICGLDFSFEVLSLVELTLSEICLDEMYVYKLHKVNSETLVAGLIAFQFDGDRLFDKRRHEPGVQIKVLSEFSSYETLNQMLVCMKKSVWWCLWYALEQI